MQAKVSAMSGGLAQIVAGSAGATLAELGAQHTYRLFAFR